VRERSTTTAAILAPVTREDIEWPVEEGGDEHRGATCVRSSAMFWQQRFFSSTHLRCFQ